jgi:hypothetical protein
MAAAGGVPRRQGEAFVADLEERIVDGSEPRSVAEHEEPDHPQQQCRQGDQQEDQQTHSEPRSGPGPGVSFPVLTRPSNPWHLDLPVDARTVPTTRCPMSPLRHAGGVVVLDLGAIEAAIRNGCALLEPGRNSRADHSPWGGQRDGIAPAAPQRGLLVCLSPEPRRSIQTGQMRRRFSWPAQHEAWQSQPARMQRIVKWRVPVAANGTSDA